MTLCPIALDVDPIPTSPLPVDLGLIKQHVAVDFPDLDQLLEKYLLAAIEAFEGTTHRTVISRQHRWTLKDFERAFPYSFWLPRGKATAINSIAYVANGAAVTLRGPTSTPPGNDYQEAVFDSSALVMPQKGNGWPSVDIDAPAPVTITYTAGWQPDEMPADVLNALLFYVRTSLDDNRTDPQKSEANLNAFWSMCSGYQLQRFY